MFVFYTGLKIMGGIMEIRKIGMIVLKQFAAGLFILLALTGCSDTQEGSVSIEQFTLPNGMEVVLKENHASPMITSLVFVRAGSKYENEYNNGVTHLLEHVLFNGTVNQSQEQIEEGVERLGGYINAYTQKDFTAYIVLMPKEFIEYGMATQADMLFNSVMPEDKLSKERKIVIEEIKMGDDAESAPAESFFEAKAFAGTPYERPIIGYESIITNIPKEAIADYYKHYYAPNNMMTIVIGDFDPAAMKKRIEKVFGPFERVELPPKPELSFGRITGKKVFKTPANTNSVYIDFAVEVPHFTDQDYFAFNILEDYLADRENSPLSVVLRSGGSPLATEVGVSLDTREEFTRLNLSIVSERTDLIDSIIQLTDMTLSGLSAVPPPPDLINGYKTSRRCQDIYLSEKLHYYGFMKAPLLAVTGWDFFSSLQDNIDKVTFEEVAAAAQKYLDNPGYIATAVYPAGPNDKGKEWAAEGPSEAAVKSHFASTQFPEFDLTTGKKLEFPTTVSIEDTEEKHSSYLKETLENGLTVIIKSNPDSRVFALNVIGKNRSATEPEGQDGITDFVNRMVERGTIGKSAEELSKALTKIGAQVTLYDNPWIPYDDRYTSRRYSFMKFETIDQFADEGIRLFGEMIKEPRLDPEEVEKVRQELFGILGRKSGSTYQSARDDYYGALFEGTAYARTVEGTYRTIGTITLDDLKNHYAKMYSPENMIITVGTSERPEKVIGTLKEVFGSMPATGFVPGEPETPKAVRGVKKAHEQMDKEQVYIYLGNLLPSAHDKDAMAMDVAGEILSRRLRQNLRETQGLAYSVGASVNLDKNFGWLLCSMGTSAKNFEKAKNGMLDEIEKLKTNPPTADEVEMAVNGIWGSYLTANLSRINQVYYMGVYEFMGLGYNFGDEYIKKIREVTPEQVTAAAEKYFDTKNYVIATAGNI